MNQQPNHAYEFGEYRLEVTERLLLRNGQAIPLQPKVFDLLLILVEHSNHLLEKDELLHTIWPDAIVEEANLSNNISILRKTLGNGEKGHHYIETIPKHGYRFIAEVKIADEELTKTVELPPLLSDLSRMAPTSVATAEPQAATPRRHIAVSTGWLLIAGVVMAGLVFASYYFWSRRSVAHTPINSLAVLPFKSLTAESRDEALEIGMASALIVRLGSLRQLIVRPESAVERYARAEQDPLAAGREQKVDAVLDSRYQRANGKFRFTLRLLHVADGATLWADTIDQPTADLFALQDAISGKVTSALRLTLSSADKELLAKRYTSSAEAWKLYVRGRHLLHQRRIPDIEKAITYFERAIALDPGFALTHATLGHSYASLGQVGHIPMKEVMPKAKAAYEQALKLDDQLAEAHSYLACYKQSTEWDYNAAEQHHQRALDLNPNSADVRQEYAFYLAMLGRFEQAIPEYRKAEELDPTDQWISRNVGMILFYARRYDEAIEQSRRAIELNPNSGPAYIWIIRAYEMKGEEQNAFTASLKHAEVNGVKPEQIATMKAAFAMGGWKGLMRNRFDRLLEREKREYVAQHGLALHYARLGEKEQALARLHRAVENRDFFVVALNVEPAWDSFRTDPRFMALVRRVGLTP